MSTTAAQVGSHHRSVSPGGEQKDATTTSLLRAVHCTKYTRITSSSNGCLLAQRIHGIDLHGSIAQRQRCCGGVVVVGGTRIIRTSYLHGKNGISCSMILLLLPSLIVVVRCCSIRSNDRATRRPTRMGRCCLPGHGDGFVRSFVRTSSLLSTTHPHCGKWSVRCCCCCCTYRWMDSTQQAMTE